MNLTHTAGISRMRDRGRIVLVRNGDNTRQREDADPKHNRNELVKGPEGSHGMVVAYPHPMTLSRQCRSG